MTNKTDKNSNAIRAAAPSQSEQPSTDTNPKKFEVILYSTQRSSGSTIIEANSLEEAKEKAANIQPYEIEWEPCDGDISINFVEVYTEGGR